MNLTTIVDEVVRDLAPVATDKDQQFVVEYDKGVKINGNKEALKMIVRNLLDNAIVYTQDHGRVAISIKETPDGCYVSISDNGPGIPEKEIEHVFERFYRGNTVTASGSGLGLSIAKWIADQPGAFLELANLAPGLECKSYLL